jgi:hypothetical protein
MRFYSLILLIGLPMLALSLAAPKPLPQRESVLLAIDALGLSDDNAALIKTNEDVLSLEQLVEILRFSSDPTVIADAQWFDVSKYSTWDDYNFRRPQGDVIMGVLARRDLFLDAALALNNRTLTNMSPQALAALAFSQVYVEEKWDHQPPWDGDSNDIFNWIHPDVIANPNIFRYVQGDYLYQARVESWWVTYWSSLMGVLNGKGVGRGTDEDAVIGDMRPPAANVPRLAGYGYPVGNQLFMQTAETVYWYADYLKSGSQRYGTFQPGRLDTQIHFPADLTQFLEALETESSQSVGISEMLNSTFAADLRRELQLPETAAFWNVVRFLYAAARQREGGGSPLHPENGQPAIMALQYQLRTPFPVGRKTDEVSAFALLTTVYADSILLDFTNWDIEKGALIVFPVNESRSDNIHRLVSERNKAIRVVEQMGSEVDYPNATHVAGSRGLGFNLATQLDDPAHGDFLPYTPEEALALVMALVVEARDYAVESSQFTFCNSPLLKAAYEHAHQAAEPGDKKPVSWTILAGSLCSV